MKSDSTSLNELYNLKAYQLSNELSELIWLKVCHWSFFEKDTMGKQFIRATDSISANIAEGYGRFFFKEKIKFYYYARGSIFEVNTWNAKCYNRKLIDQTTYLKITSLTEQILPKLNTLIKNNSLQVNKK